MQSSMSRVRIALAVTGATAVAMIPTATQGNPSGRVSASTVASLGVASAGVATVGSGNDSAATRVTAPCEAGPGRMAVAVLPLTKTGKYPVRVTARGVREGSRWQIRVAWEDAAQLRRFRRTATDGTWSITTQMPDSPRHEPAFDVQASGGNFRFSCAVGVTPNPSVASGYGSCGNGVDGLSVRRRRDGTFSVGAFVLAVAPEKTRWHIKLTVRSHKKTEQTVAFDDYSNRYAELASEATFSHLPTDPRFVLLAKSRTTGSPCRLWMNPATLSVPVRSGSTGPF